MIPSSPRDVRMPRAARLLTVGVAAAVLLGTAFAQTPLPAHAADPVLNTASGVEIFDIDGGTLQAQTPLSQWSSGPDVSRTSDGTGSKFKLNTTVTSGISTSAGVAGSASSITTGEFTLRDRPPVTFTGLRSVCAPDGTSTVAFDSLAVDGKDLTAQANNTAATPAGFTYNLPDSMYGPTRIIVGERSTASDGTLKVTGLRVEAESGASEIWRVRLAEVTCASYAVDAPAPDPVITTPLVTGITVTAQDGTVLIDGEPRITEAGTTATADSVTAANFPSAATDVTVSAALDGASTVSIGQFTQVPDTSAIGEYLWSALRVYGLNLDVAADGSSAVSFDNSGSAVFVNGVWINTATDLYTGVDANGDERVLVHFNERTVNADGSLSITALRYEDLTGVHPDVSLGQVTVPAVDIEPVTPISGVSLVEGVRVTAPDGTVLINGEPQVTETGTTETAGTVTAKDFPSIATDVTVTAAESGGATASIGQFTQIPDTSSIGEYLWSALRVYGLHLDVAADGSSAVSFDNSASAVFVNGVWINTATDLYTGVDASGVERVRVYFNERVTNADGSTTITALRYEDLTGVNPDVSLGRVVVMPAAIPEVPGEPEVPAVPEAPALPQWYAYGVLATGPSAVGAAPLAVGAAQENKTGDASDGATGQVAAAGITVSAARTAASADAASVTLYPNTRAAVSLANLRVAADEQGTTVTSDGGTVAGTAVPAGEIAPNTVFSLEGTAARVVLNEQITVDGNLTVLGLHFTDVSGLASDVRVAGVTTVAPTVVDPTDPTAPTDPTDPSDPADPVDPGNPGNPADPADPSDPSDPIVDPANPGTGPGVPGAGVPGAGVNPGALSPDGSSPAGTSGTQNNSVGSHSAGSDSDDSADGLANTGTTALGAGLLALLLLAAGAVALLVRRRASAQQ